MRATRVLPLVALLAVAACAPNRIGAPNATMGAVREPISFVHGYKSSGAIWQTMVGRFKADGYTDVERAAWVSLAGANHGTNTARFCATQSCVEMRPGSAFLAKLNAKDETPGAPRYATWWSSCGQVILPQTSTRLSGATNTQAACLQHSDLYVDATVYGQVKGWVTNGVTILASQ